MLHRRLIATILAASVAVTGLTAAPARADNSDLAKVLLGATALVVIGSAIAEGADRDRRVIHRAPPRTKVVRHHHRYKAPVSHRGAYAPVRRHGAYAPVRHRQVHSHAPRRVQPGRARIALPKACRVRNAGNRTVYSARCLQRRGY